MAYSIGGMVLYGELRNTHRNTVFGTIVARGRDRPITVRLAGNCAGDLHGRHVLFGTPAREDALPEDIDLSVLASEQCGPLGVATLERPGSALAGGATGQDMLLLEWFGQNGLVHIEIPGVTVETCDEATGRSGGPPEGSARGSTLRPAARAPGESCERAGVFFSAEAGRRAFSSPVAKRLDARAAKRLLRSVTNADLHRLDFEPAPVRAFTSIFEEPLEYRPPDSLDEAEIDFELARLLLQFAYLGLAVDICEHATSFEVYRYLVEDVIPSRGEFSPETFLNATTHYSFYERCRSCQREFDECFA